jgi:small subunit ribosomal protein S4
MARYLGPKCKLSRREGTDLLLKSRARPIESKCQIDKTPGEHGGKTKRLSDYALQLREKQKLRRIYGILEKQFRGYFHEAARLPGATGENLLRLLETRLDNLVYRMGFAPSRPSARQLVLHGHFVVNGKRASVPSFQVKPGDVVSVREGSRNVPLIQSTVESRGGRDLPDWLEANVKTMKGRLLRNPVRDTIPISVQENMIVELYSK